MYINSFIEFINEAHKVNADFIEITLTKNKDILLKAANKNAMFLLKTMNQIFKSKFKFEHSTILNINKLSKDLKSEIAYINKKIKKYPRIKDYLKYELEEYNLLLKYVSNKNNNNISIEFLTYNQYNNIKPKNLFSKFTNWLSRKLTPTLKYREFNRNEESFKKIITHDFRIFSALYDFIDNEFKVIFDEDFNKSLNEENFKFFATQLKIILKHELIHQKDFLNKTIGELRTNDQYAPYAAKNTEIKSWASDVIEELKSNKFSKKEIENILLEPDKHITEVKSSDALNMYYTRYYDMARILYYKLISECLDYLNDHYEKTNIR